MPHRHEQFMKFAFKYPLGAAKKHKFSQSEVTALIKKAIERDDLGEMVDYLPNAPLRSSIIDYTTYAHFWMLVPSYIRIRIPQLVFKASEDGYNVA